MNLVPVYGPGVESVRRSVVHLLPGVRVVLDDVVLSNEDMIRVFVRRDVAEMLHWKITVEEIVT